LAYDAAEPRSAGRFIEAPVPLSADDEVAAIHVLDAVNAFEAILDADWRGNRRWRVRAVTATGRDIARLVREDHVWSRLKTDLARVGEPFQLLARGFRDNVTVTLAPDRTGHETAAISQHVRA
jgi:hypothetical protein